MTSYVRAADVGVVVEDGDGDAVVYLAPLPHGPIHVLNGVASLIWLEATKPSASGNLVDRIAGRVDQPRETIYADVESFVAQLVQSGFMEPNDA